MVPMMFADAKEQEKKALELLELVGLSHKKDSKLSQLSGGEQQRVAIAIALANSPKILLADEPTGSVDTRTSNYIMDVFRKINREMGVTVVIVTHDMALTKKVNRIISIRDGKTSSERIMKKSYAEELANVQLFSEQSQDVADKFQFEMVHEEYAVLDRAGRVQIPREILDMMNITDNKVKIEFVEGKIIISGDE